jgi:hypothetical protein
MTQRPRSSSLESHYILFSTYVSNKKRHIGYLFEYTGLLFRKVAYSRQDMFSKMFQVDSTLFVKINEVH